MFRSLSVIGVTLVCSISAGMAQAETVYFLVGEKYPSYNDCYVLALSNLADIRHARRIILNPQTTAQIVVAVIERSNPDGLNRNYVAEGLPVWSWRVNEFLGFWEATPEIMDGSPTDVEEYPGMWPSGSTIGFWSYTVVKELGTDLEIWNCDLSADDIIDFEDVRLFAEDWLEPVHWGADIDGSYSVDFADFAIMASHWLEHTPDQPHLP